MIVARVFPVCYWCVSAPLLCSLGDAVRTPAPYMWQGLSLPFFQVGLENELTLIDCVTV